MKKLLFLPLALVLTFLALSAPAESGPCCLGDSDCIYTPCPPGRHPVCDNPESGCGQCRCAPN